MVVRDGAWVGGGLLRWVVRSHRRRCARRTLSQVHVPVGKGGAGNDPVR